MNIDLGGRMQLRNNLRHHPEICLEGLRKITKTLSKYSQSQGHEKNPEPPNAKQNS
jgi:hypothetical protein